MVDKKYTISDLSSEELNTIMIGLGELPAKMTIGIIQKIQMQYAVQNPPVFYPPPESNSIDSSSAANKTAAS